ncbi:Uncharacterised protein [Acholeplasma oculi]|uniref:Uncharacterized protein n=1 Tax=Acholeplasma oculi TaxID=35623 RepID=A0A061AC83_9MOLU|nr:hypothetical protein [Acholeplasma oculi]CDR31019.1 hypothetical protein Aocu_09460 [Acholeplasma oculi]SKC36411.1 hypothetical protein SAMN02745122_0371 [Acholeplasma oculi]SUT90500.1 Uncharacterised protein [Acholeplasma oculi]
MRRRIFISLIISILLLISFSFVYPFLELDYSIIYTVGTVILFVLLFVYLFSGIHKFIVVFIYSVIIISGLLVLPDYQQPMIAIGTLMIVLNPLANFEQYIERKLRDEDTLPLRISIRGKYWPFYSYRQEMKNYVRLPQTKKLFTKKWYLRSRQLLTVTMLFAGIYLFISELRNIYIDLQTYNPIQFFTFYGVVTLFVLTFILYKKGFNALFRAAIMFIYVPMILAIWLLPISLTSQIILTVVISLLGIADIIYEKVSSLNRVAYHAYKYYDQDDQRYVFANDFYEPFVYNETYHIVGIYKFRIDLETFQKHIHEVLFYSNRKHFMITAYTYNGSDLMIYTDFFHKHGKRAQNFSTFLENLYHTQVSEQIVYDKNKQIYEKTFFHKTDYIVARALSLADLLNDLHIINNELIISIIFSFKEMEDILKLSKLYYVARLEELDDAEYYAARVSIRVSNSKFAIEQKVRDLLLNAMIYKAQYVRILVYYEGEK